jgi:hypothetical protein
MQSRIFQPIPRSVERDSVLSDAASHGSEIYVKYSAIQTLTAKILKWIPPFKLQISYPEGPRALVQKLLPVQFNCRGDKYFAQAYPQDTGGQFFLVIEGPIYKVQRRQSFRLKLPSNYPMTVQLFEINGQKINETAKLLDLSEGGCSLAVPAKLGQVMGAHLGLHIKIGTRPAFTQCGRIRYLKAEKNNVRLGLQFDQNTALNSEIFNLTRDLYVELFSKWARRK